MQESLQVGTISEGHARTLLSLQKYPSAQKTLFAHIVSKGWSVRQAEQFAIVVKRGNDTSKETTKPVKPAYTATAKAIEKQLGTKVSLQHSVKGKGKIVISYKTEEDLARITKAILGK